MRQHRILLAMATVRPGLRSRESAVARTPIVCYAVASSRWLSTAVAGLQLG